MKQANEPKKRILVADDDPVVRKLFEGFLTQAGYQIKLVTNGRQAVTEAPKFQPDLIFLDVVMPEMDGFEALETLRRNRKTRKIPVIIITSRSDTTTLLKALKLGADDFMAKPFLKSDLFRKMNYVLVNRFEMDKTLEANLVQSDSTFINGTTFDIMRESFILNFEHVYINLLKLISVQNQSELKKAMTRLLDAINFYKLTAVKGKVVQLLVAVKTAEWERAVELLESVYLLFQDLRQTLPGTLE